MARNNLIPTTTTIDEYSSQKVFQLKRDKQLEEAYNLAIQLYNDNPNDAWVQKAYAWVLIDKIKIEINNDISKAQSFFNQLQSINFLEIDEILLKQINFLKPKLNVIYQQILQAETLSKDGKHEDALKLFRQLKEEDKLTQENYESYGWSIYRYIRDSEQILDAQKMKVLLFEYMQLKNLRPSNLHSAILQFSIGYSTRTNNIDIYRFFQLWNPEYLRDEDKEKQHKDNKIYPSLVERLLRLFIDKNYQIDITYLQQVIDNDNLVIETIREVYFWKLLSFYKENRSQDLWRFFYIYGDKFSNFGASRWHSEILKIANRFMIDENEWRFFDFFQQWNHENLRYEDWQEERNGENVYKSLALKSLSVIFKQIKAKNKEINDLDWILTLYSIALKKEKENTWLLREYATLLNIANRNDEAIDIYKKIILDLSDQAYAWHEFSKLLEKIDTNIAISMLCKAMLIQKNEDFLDKIHLDLAKLFLIQNKFVEAKIELLHYQEHREKKEWKLSEEFFLLKRQVEHIELIKNDNVEFYTNNIILAEEYIYSDIEWIDLLLYEKWITKEKKEKIAFTNLDKIEIAVNPYRFQILKNSKIHEVYKFKLHYDKTKERYISLKIEKSDVKKESFLDNVSCDIAIIDHINTDKELFHYTVNQSKDGIVKFSQTKIRPKIGNFIEIKYFEIFDKKNKKQKTNILSINLTDKVNSSLLKNIVGNLSLKYKEDGRTYSYDEIIDEQLDINITEPDFAFINDYYVPKYLLKKYHIEQDCQVEAQVLFDRKKWNVFDLKIL